MLPVVTAEEMRAIDAETISELGIPGAVLMENAGRAIVARVIELLASSTKEGVGVLCGGGNNGGDGYVAARVLRELGHSVRLYAAAPVGALKGDAKLHAEAFVACGGEPWPLIEAKEIEEAEFALRDCALIVDALFGTGLSRPLEGHYQAIVELVNSLSATVVAADIPSGLSCNDGSTLGVSVHADATVCFAAAKPGVVGAPGFVQCGDVSIPEIGIPVSLAKRVATIGLLECADIRSALAAPGGNAHKGTRGHVLAIAGSPGKQGAGRLTGMAALRAGAGLVTLASAEPDASAEDPLMTATLGSDAAARSALLAGKGALVVGPGMDSSPAGASCVEALLEESKLPMVLDADALNHLVKKLDRVASAKVAVILTPHPGEAGRLLETSSSAVQQDRIAAVRELAKRSGAVVVLKGARTCICDGRTDSDFVAINPTGGPELGTAGTGDVLAGTIAALLGRGVEPCLAAQAAVYWHGAAGTLVTDRLGGPGLVATDLIDALPLARARLTDF